MGNLVTGPTSIKILDCEIPLLDCTHTNKSSVCLTVFMKIFILKWYFFKFHYFNYDLYHFSSVTDNWKWVTNHLKWGTSCLQTLDTLKSLTRSLISYLTLHNFLNISNQEAFLFYATQWLFGICNVDYWGQERNLKHRFSYYFHDVGFPKLASNMSDTSLINFYVFNVNLKTWNEFMTSIQ